MPRVTLLWNTPAGVYTTNAHPAVQEMPRIRPWRVGRW